VKGIPVRVPKPKRRIRAADIRYATRPLLPAQNEQLGDRVRQNVGPGDLLGQNDQTDG
jgi:hypothetical protein